MKQDLMEKLKNISTALQNVVTLETLLITY